jgi:RNA polymerase sigma-70 factor (ECF subfamily)
MSDAAAGDEVEQEAGRLLKEHAAILGRVAMALLGDATRVEQVLEQVAREVGSHGSVPDEKPLVWLLGLLRVASATQLSKLPFRTRPGPEVPPKAGRLPAWQLGDEAKPARKALSRLKPTEREAVVLSFVAGLSVDEVAKACNVDPDTAKGRLERGLEQLMEVSQ